jgi:hypothetical protein
LLNLGHLELEKRLHEKRIGAAENEPRSLWRLLDAFEDGTNRVTLMEVFAMVLLSVRNDRFGFAKLVQHYHELAALDLLHFTGEEIADPAREFVADL